MCHFVDTCAAIAGEAALDVAAMGTGGGEATLAEDLVVSLRYPGGSLATISYASGGHPGTDKERIEVLGRSRSATVVDFRQVLLDGHKVSSGTQDKGHRGAVAAFWRAVHGEEAPADPGIASTRATLLAAASLGSG